jgi:hypothetical protein
MSAITKHRIDPILSSSSESDHIQISANNQVRPLHGFEQDLIKSDIKRAVKSKNFKEKIAVINQLQKHQTVCSPQGVHDILFTMQAYLTSCFTFDEDSAYITMEGLQVVKDHYSTTYNTWAKSDFTFISIKHIADEIAALADVDSITKRFVVSRSESPDDPHLFPLFLYKDKETISLIMTDSRGCTSDPFPIEYLSKHLPDTPLQIYAYPIKRQHDWFSCPVYSILDIMNEIELAMSGSFCLLKHVKDAAAKDPGLSKGKHDVYFIDRLPPSMMKVTQSFTAIEAHRTKTPSPEAVQPSFQRLSPDGIVEFREQSNGSLQAAVDTYTFFSNSGDKENHYVQHKWLTFVKIILASTFPEEA